MGIPYGDDLRRNFLHAYDQGEGTLEDLSGRFFVSLGWAKKIFAQRTRSGQAERVPYHPGRKLRPASGFLSGSNSSDHRPSQALSWVESTLIAVVRWMQEVFAMIAHSQR